MKITQGERISKIETHVDYIKSDVTEIKSMLKEHINKEDAFITLAEGRKTFAPIWTEWGVKAILLIIVGSVIGAALNFII